MNNILPLFYFRPTIVWIDDDSIFLEAVRLAFGKDYNCLTFDDPQKALNFFNTYEPPLSKVNFKRPFTESDVFGIYQHYPVDLNMGSIRNLLEFPEKQFEIAVLIIDYNMPNISGIELCNQFKMLPVKKILLTGEASDKQAIEVFNQGLIDKFIKKEINITDKLGCSINELCSQYFYERSADTISHLEAANPSPLTDPIFISFFNQWCHDNEIEEFYLINRQGSFLAKDSAGRLSYFILMSETDKADFIKLNDELEDEHCYLLDELATGNKIPFFGVEKESWDVSVAEWEKYFYPAQLLSGRENYYWTVIKD